eukprot:TRINITY_DN9387_c0_g1_i1.p1 TRINITY_DN9387_c0_g1~~TRINITY_DN9387_c0_g1_i1.p1  ORF type:complete len:195 (-),score=18.68 TRINITY_DN9387_c0_g1_i1:60-644(-)
MKSTIKLVRNLNTGEKYIAKCYHREKVLKNPALMAQIKNEISVMMEMNNVRVTSLIEIYRDLEEIILVIEYARGGNLCSRVIERRYYAEPEGSMLFRFLVEGLEHLHSKGILHRDLKLENIFLTSQSQDLFLKIGDFDLASFMEVLDHTKIVGTPGYIAPEVYENASYSTKSDIFSAGIILYSVLVGKLSLIHI